MTHQWALPQLRALLPLDDGELEQIMDYTSTLDDAAAAQHLENLVGDSPKALEFLTAFVEHRAHLHGTKVTGEKDASQSPSLDKTIAKNGDMKNDLASAPPPYTASSAYTVSRNLPRPVTQYTHTNNVIEAGKVRARDEVGTTFRTCMRGIDS